MLVRNAPPSAGRLILCAALLLAGCEPPRSGPASAPTKPVTQPSQSAPAQDIDALRALPYAGFSENTDDQSGLVHADAGKSAPGYSLYSVHMQSAAELIDEGGRLIHRWVMPGRSRNWDHVTLLPDGDLLVVGADLPDKAVKGIVDELRYVARLSWDGAIRWRQNVTAHHDVQITPDGKVAVLTLRRRSLPDLLPQFDTRDDEVTLLEAADGRVLSSTSILDILRARPGSFRFERVAPERFGGQVWVDLLHTNSIDFMLPPATGSNGPLYAEGNLLLCFRHQNRVAIVNPTSGQLIWTWGEGELLGPHDASVLPDGNILIYDNGLGRGWSRVIELDPRRPAIVWEYKAPQPADFYSKSKGSNQRLANGNTLIADSDNGRAFEVTRAGEIVWDYYVPHRNEKGQRAAIVRCYRYERAMIDAILKRFPTAAPASRPSSASKPAARAN